jgi:hypothetical protein
MATAIISVRPGAGKQAPDKVDENGKAYFVWPSDPGHAADTRQNPPAT